MKNLTITLMLLALISCGKKLEKESEESKKPINNEALYEDALFSAINSGDSTLVKSALEKIKDINKVFKENGETALTMAIKANKPGIVKLLLSKNVNTASKNSKNEIPVFLAIASTNQNIAKLVIDERTNFTLTNKRAETPIEYAINLDKQELALYCLLQGSPIDQRISTGINLITLAKRARMHEVVSLITNIKEYKQKGNSQIDLATQVQDGNINFLEYIFNTDKSDKLIAELESLDALNKAILIEDSYKRKIMTRLLLTHGLNPKGALKDAKPPIFTAIDQGDTYLISVLINKGVRVNKEYGQFKNPLSYAVRNGKPDCVQKILDYNAYIQLNIYTSSGYYVIDSCSYLPKRRAYRNSSSTWAKNYRAIDDMLNCD